ncbi:hypothetical protein RchiOBHm_Chr2g0162191 [Rosa chinensis]|uniref:Uncharacterized protein n=1 Tax=Rosa chinensis TaxID=74649 RepID=A0A2P6S2Y4_ROSCH|nr:hypothetical protein RchiOBHm_Chr2g0162191 [Rosa chinensis]
MLLHKHVVEVADAGAGAELIIVLEILMRPSESQNFSCQHRRHVHIVMPVYSITKVETCVAPMERLSCLPYILLQI